MDELAQVRDDLLANAETEKELRERRNGLVLEARACGGVTLEQVAEAAGMVSSYVSRVEKAQGRPASGSQLKPSGKD